MFWVFLVFMVSAVFSARQLFIVFGMHKGPVLKTCEIFGPEEILYYPLPQLLFWPGLLFTSGGILLRQFAPFYAVSGAFGAILIIGGGTAFYAEKRLRFTKKFSPLVPGWYVRLLRETSRGERRRIAYMWLRLPQRTRLLYNADDDLFFVWVELVIVSTTS